MARSRDEWEFPWIEAVPGLMLGLGLGLLIASFQGYRLAGVTTSPLPYPDSWAYQYKPLSIFVMAVIAGAIVAYGFFHHAERQFYNYAIIGIGLGCMMGAASFTMEKVEVASDKVVYKSWWGLSQFEIKFAELRQLRSVEHHRPPSIRKRNNNRLSLHYQMQSGGEGMLCNSNSACLLFYEAWEHLVHSAVKHGVEIKREHTHEN